MTLMSALTSSGMKPTAMLPCCMLFGFYEISSPSPRDRTAACQRHRGHHLVLGFGADGCRDTPLTLTPPVLQEKKIAGNGATEEQLHKLEGIRRLLLRLKAVHAVSAVAGHPLPSGRQRPLRRLTGDKMPPIFRRASSRPRVLLAALFRYMMGRLSLSLVLSTCFFGKASFSARPGWSFGYIYMRSILFRPAYREASLCTSISLLAAFFSMLRAKSR